MVLGESIDWKGLADDLADNFCADNGRPSLGIRPMVELHYMKCTYDLSDEVVVAEWCSGFSSMILDMLFRFR